jgi:hypothetical protein
MFPGTAPNGTNAVAVYDNFFRALAAPARLSRRPAGMSWRTPDQNARKRERAWTIAEHTVPSSEVKDAVEGGRLNALWLQRREPLHKAIREQ